MPWLVASALPNGLRFLAYSTAWSMQYWPAPSELAACRQEIAWDALAARRDYAFCLYPEDMLRSFFATPSQR